MHVTVPRVVIFIEQEVFCELTHAHEQMNTHARTTYYMRMHTQHTTHITLHSFTLKSECAFQIFCFSNGTFIVLC